MAPRLSRRKKSRKNQAMKDKKDSEAVHNPTTELDGLSDGSPEQNGSVDQFPIDPIVAAPTDDATTEEAMNACRESIKDIHKQLLGCGRNNTTRKKQLQAQLAEYENKLTELDRQAQNVPPGEDIMQEDTSPNAREEVIPESLEEGEEEIPDSRPETQPQPRQPERLNGRTEENLQLAMAETATEPQETAVAAETDTASDGYFTNACVFNDDNTLTEGALESLVSLIASYEVPGATETGKLPKWMIAVLAKELLQDENNLSFTFNGSNDTIEIKTGTSVHFACGCLQCVHKQLCCYIAAELRDCISALLQMEGSDPVVQNNVREVFSKYFQTTQYVTVCNPVEVRKELNVSFRREEKEIITPFFQPDRRPIMESVMTGLTPLCPFGQSHLDHLSTAPDIAGLCIVGNIRQPKEAGPWFGDKERLLNQTVVGEALQISKLLLKMIRIYNELHSSLPPLIVKVSTYLGEDINLLASFCERGDGLNSDVRAAVKDTADKLARQNPFCSPLPNYNEVFFVIAFNRNEVHDEGKPLQVVPEKVYVKNNGGQYIAAGGDVAERLSRFGNGDLKALNDELHPLRVHVVPDTLNTVVSIGNRKMRLCGPFPYGASSTSAEQQERLEQGKFARWANGGTYLFKCTACAARGVVSTLRPTKLGFNNSSLHALGETVKKTTCECMQPSDNDFEKLKLQNVDHAPARKKRKLPTKSTIPKANQVSVHSLPTGVLNKLIGPASAWAGKKKRRDTRGYEQDYP